MNEFIRNLSLEESPSTMMTVWMPNRDFLFDWPGRRGKAFEQGFSRLNRDVWQA